MTQKHSLVWASCGVVTFRIIIHQHIMKRSLLIEILSWPVALLLLYAALSKLWHFPVFRLQLGQSPWHLLSALSPVIAWGLPLAELSLVLMLLWPAARSAGFALSGILFAVFIVYLAILLSADVRLPCSCGGIISRLGWKGHIYLNIGFLVLSAAGFYLSQKQRHVPRQKESGISRF